jgi:threonine/homoserine/homoserine lactone efflux protein
LDHSLYTAFVVATTIMILLPGPSVLLTVAPSLSFGPRRALDTVAGATCGVAVQLCVTLIGMTSLMLIVAQWFEWLRWLGVAYLVFLGVQLWRARPSAAASVPLVSPGRSLFLQGLVVTTANPKSMFFLAAFFPQFVDPAAPPVLQFTLMGLSFLVITYVFTALWAVVAGRARPLLRSRSGVLLRNRISGGLMIGAGLGLAVARRV